MRAAPPAFDLALGSGRAERGLIGALYGLTGAAGGAWLAARYGMPIAPLALAGAIGAAAPAAFVVRPLRGRLRWDGACWCHRPERGEERKLRTVTLNLDLGGWMLLRVVPEPAGPAGSRHVSFRLPGAQWCGVARRRAGNAWHPLRLALYRAPQAPEAGGVAPR